jgi:hypothetical protein
LDAFYITQLSTCCSHERERRRGDIGSWVANICTVRKYIRASIATQTLFQARASSVTPSYTSSICFGLRHVTFIDEDDEEETQEAELSFWEGTILSLKNTLEVEFGVVIGYVAIISTSWMRRCTQFVGRCQSPRSRIRESPVAVSHLTHRHDLRLYLRALKIARQTAI